MESCYVPNNPNFASVDQWTPPSPTSPPVASASVSVDASKQQHHQQQQHPVQYQQQQPLHHHDPVIHQLCESADLVSVNSTASVDSPSHLTSLSVLPPVQELLGPCRSPNGDVSNSVGCKDRGVDPFSTYSLTALDFEPLPGFLTLSSCASYKDRQHQEMGDLPLGFKTSHASGYGYQHSPQQQHHHQNGPMSPFSAAVAAATQQQQQHQQSTMNGGQQCQPYSFHGSNGSSSSKTGNHPASGNAYQESGGSGSYGSNSSGLFPSMSVNVSMNMTMGMGMSMGPTMSYGIETGAALQCWNPGSHHSGSANIHHLPGVAAAAAAAAAVSVNSNVNSTYPPAQALLSPIQVSYNSNIYPTSFTPSSAGGYCLSGDWRPPGDSSSGLYELKELKESASSPFGGSNGGSKPYAKLKQAGQQNAYSQYPSDGCYPSAVVASSPTTASSKKSRPNKGSTAVANLSSGSIDYDGDGTASCGGSSSGGSVASESGGGGVNGKANLCRVCGKTYARPSTLKTHMRTHSGERPYRCGDCHKSFSQAANLTAHVRTHSGEKPFRCQICDRRFSQSSSVTTHMRTHSGERPYRCRMCKKAFSDSSTLTKHMRIHSGEKPYQCKLCLLRFSQSGNLNRHMRVHSANS